MMFSGSQSVRSLWSLLLVSGSIAGVAWLGSISWGDDPPQTAAVGLQGILPEQAPNDLRIEKLEALTAELPESWKEWGQTTMNAILDFYEVEHPSIESQRAALAQLQRKLYVIESALGDPQYHAVRGELALLYGRLAARVALAQAILDTLTMDEQQALTQRTAPAFDRLESALAATSRELQQISGGQQWRPWLNLASLEQIVQSRDTSPAAVQAVAEVKSKLAARDTYSEQVQQFLTNPFFLELEDALGMLVGATNVEPQSQEDLRALLKQLVDAVEAYMVEPNAQAAYDIRRLDAAIRQAAPDGGNLITTALNRHFFNYNLRLVVAEGLLERLLDDQRVETSGINEYMLGALVRGSQVTRADVGVDLKPSQQGARILLQLNGNIRSSTVGYAEQATVQSVGYHNFWATKPVIFTGERFYTEPATVTAAANNQVVDATTQYSGGLFGHIADRIALREASSRAPQANAITVNRIRRQVSEQLNTEANQQLEQASMRLQEKVYGPLREYGLYPQTMDVSSNEVELIYRSRLMDAGELGGSPPLPGTFVPADGALVLVHESLLTNSTARMDLAGKTMTEEQVRQHLQERLSNILGRDVSLPQPSAPEGEEPMNNTLVFDERDAIRFSIGNGLVTVIIRAGLKREGQEDIPEHVIEVPLRFTVQGDQVQMTRGGEVAVRPAPGTPRTSPVEMIARQNVMRQTIQSALEEATFDGTIEAQIEDKTIPLQIGSIEARSGWLVLTVQ